MALAKCADFNFRLQRGASLAYLRRWFCILGIALQEEVVFQILIEHGADLGVTATEIPPSLSELPV